MTLRLSDDEWAALNVDPLQVDEEPWPTAEPVLPKRRDSVLLLLGLLGMLVILAAVWGYTR